MDKRVVMRSKRVRKAKKNQRKKKRHPKPMLLTPDHEVQGTVWEARSLVRVVSVNRFKKRT